jgi:hypothetical protein
MTFSGNFIDQTAITTFDQMLEQVFFQTNFRCQRFLEKATMVGKRRRVNRIFSEGLPVALDNRVTPITQTNETEFDARWVTTKDHVSVEYVSEDDITEALLDPKGELAHRQVERFNRKLDIDSVNSMFGTTEIGVNGGTFISAATDHVLTVTATGGLTYEKLLEIKEDLIDNEVINEGSVDLYMGITGQEHTDLLEEIELTNALYNSEKNAEKGEIVHALGIELIRFGRNAPDPILPVASGVRTSFCVTNKAMRLYVQREMETIVEKDPTLHKMWRVLSYMRYGFLRMDGRHILKINLTA